MAMGDVKTISGGIKSDVSFIKLNKSIPVLTTKSTNLRDWLSQMSKVIKKIVRIVGTPTILKR